jgi:HAD superfamily hydrolase (TIGR01509 family)
MSLQEVRPMVDGVSVEPQPAALWICDVNGVLIDSSHLVREAFAATAARWGFAVGDRAFQRVKGLWLLEAYRVLDPGGDAAQRRQYHVSYIRERIAEVRAYPDVAPTLAAAKARDVRVAATTSHGEIAEACLVASGLYPYVDCLVTQEEVKHPKPDPESIHVILRLFGAPPPNCGSPRPLHVGDTAPDIVAGKAAGIRTVGVTYGLSDEAEIAAAMPDAVIRSFDGMRQFLPGRVPAERREQCSALTV